MKLKVPDGKLRKIGLGIGLNRTEFKLIWSGSFLSINAYHALISINMRFMTLTISH